MLVLNEYNKVVDLNLIPDSVDMHFWVFENSLKHDEADYYCQPLIMLESFHSPCMRLKFTVKRGRNYEDIFLNLPSDFQILVGEPSHSDLEVNPITSLSGRNFNAFSVNPMSSFTMEFIPVDIEEVYPTTKWYMPKMKSGQLLCVPLENTEKPLCVYIVRDIPKTLEVVKMSKVW